MKAIWRYIEAHHEQWGIALFILPVCLVVFVLIVVWDLVERVLR